MTAILIFLRTTWPYLLAAIVGAVLAWQVQSIRVSSAKRDTADVKRQFEDYKTEQKRLLVVAGEQAEKRREKTIKDWSDKYGKLKNDTDIYKRCVAAGKCGRVSNLSGGSGIKLPAASGIDGSVAHAIFTPGDNPEVIKDCAMTTLQLNALQADIEAQLPKN